MELARRHGDYALVGVAAVVTLAGDRIGAARLALTGVGDRPVRAKDAEARLAGESLTPAVLADAAEAVRRAIDPGGDIHATPAYRRHVAGVLVARAVRLAVARAKEAERG
jgi:carbon-monoxide dehydrogenase medium subunit